MIRYYDSPAHMVRDAAENCAHTRDWQHDDAAWAGPNGADLNAMLARGGDESDVPAAMELLEKLALELPETESAQFLPSVAGAYPCVSDALVGLPEPMRQRFNVTSDGAPVRIGVVTTVSASIRPDAFRAKAAAMLAILLHLQNSGRAVELYGISHMHGTDTGETVLAYRITSAPISLAECNMALGNLAFARRVPFAIARHYNGFNGKWPTKYDEYSNGQEYTADLAKRMGFQMILPSLYEAEVTKIVRDPAAWMVAKYNAIQAQIEAGA